MKGRDVDDGTLEPLGRLARAAASAPVDPEAAQASRQRFLQRLGTRAGGGRLFAFSLLLTATAAATVALTILTTRPSVDPPMLAGGTLVRFGDGSEIELDADGRGRLAEVAPAGARVVLEQGTLRVRVTPRPGTHWTIEAGPFCVHVKGTAFRVSWDRVDGRFEVTMFEGTVHTTGPRLDQMLHAGQHLTTTIGSPASITSPPATTSMPATTSPAATPSTADTSPTLPARAPSSPSAAAPLLAVPRVREPAHPRESSWSSLLTRGDLVSLLDRAEAEGLPRALQRRGLADLTALATAARLSQRADVARRAYRAQRIRFPGSGPAREAAFHLGRLADDSDADPAAALAWYDQYLAESPTGVFGEEALGRKLAALERLPDRAAPAVAEAARRYLARFPDGPRRDLARRLLDPR